MGHKIPTIKNWALYKDPYSAPELGISMTGNVYGSSQRADGTGITTSAIVTAKDGLITTISGSKYHIHPEDVNALYEQHYPNAYNRLFKIGV